MLKKYGFVPDKLVTNELRSYIMLRRPLISGSQDAMSAADGATIERIIRVSQPDEAKPRCRGSSAAWPSDFYPSMQHLIMFNRRRSIHRLRCDQR
jgi:hypothetical protein